ncbi:hypothetical protein HG536_0D00700 [Torulaspora globosa]|uniref:Uncharacterized protein n=1 Tax=Torulaspora globosa TaxID=48254 RepID=A0A7G3ZGB2_9SACH|nr:uncharacterized protein HG536_0D00700 [Torulaspora globosa]QLL32548.1 hypothetical protein HG536_0D00700 [Torulaspora globosa]
MYNMNLGEKTDIRTGISKTSALNDEPLESYIPGVGRKNRSPSAGMTGDYSQASEAYHPTAAQHPQEKNEPLESYIPGVGRRNHPLDPELAKEGKMGHSTGAQPHLPESTSKGYGSEPHIPGCGRITEPPQHMKKCAFNPNEMLAAKMDSQHMASSQTTTIPGFESEGKTRIPGTETSRQSYPSENDSIDRENLPRPAHVSESANTGVNAPARRDSRKLSDFNEPSDFDRNARRASNRQDKSASDFPAHTYDTSKDNSVGGRADEPGRQGTKVASGAAATHESSHRKDSSTSGPKIFGKELHFGKSSHSQNTSESTSHSESTGPKLFGKEIGIHKSHHEKDRDSEGSSHSGPKIFGKESNSGKEQQERSHETNVASGPAEAPTGSEHTTGTRSGGSVSGGDRRASTGSTGDKNKLYPSKVPTVEDQPVKRNASDSGVKKTDRSLSIGSEEAGSYAKNIGNMPAMVDPRFPTYRHKEETTATIGEGGSYKVHSENMTERKVSVGSQENEPHEPGSDSRGTDLSTGSHHTVSHDQEHKEPIFEYGPEAVPRSHQQKDISEEDKGESHQGHSKPGIIGTIKNVISHHSNE